jgi:hypothetical protein
MVRHRLLPENSSQGRIEPRIIVLHSAAGAGDSLYNWFSTGSNLESHFYVSRNGGAEQYIDTNIRADANYHANGFALSIETENDPAIVRSHRWDDDPWTDPQLAKLIEICNYLASIHPGIRRQKCTSWDGTGLGWHIMFGSPGPWTPSAKACPGARRIQQVKDIILPAFTAGIVAPTPSQHVDAPAGVPALRRGATGARVSQLQRALNYGIQSRLTVDGDFGGNTDGAVRNLQSFFGLDVDGVYGPKSQWWLQVSCNQRST